MERFKKYWAKSITQSTTYQTWKLKAWSVLKAIGPTWAEFISQSIAPVDRTRYMGLRDHIYISTFLWIWFNKAYKNKWMLLNAIIQSYLWKQFNNFFKVLEIFTHTQKILNYTHISLKFINNTEIVLVHLNLPRINFHLPLSSFCNNHGCELNLNVRLKVELQGLS